MLAKEVGPCEEPVVKGIKLWSEVVWCHSGRHLFEEKTGMEYPFQKTTSSLAVSLKMAVTAPRRQQKVVEWLLEDI